MNHLMAMLHAGLIQIGRVVSCRFNDLISSIRLENDKLVLIVLRFANKTLRFYFQGSHCQANVTVLFNDHKP